MNPNSSKLAVINCSVIPFVPLSIISFDIFARMIIIVEVETEKAELSRIQGIKLFVRAKTHASEPLLFLLLKYIILFHKLDENIQIVECQNG